MQKSRKFSLLWWVMVMCYNEDEIVQNMENLLEFEGTSIITINPHKREKLGEFCHNIRSVSVSVVGPYCRKRVGCGS